MLFLAYNITPYVSFSAIGHIKLKLMQIMHDDKLLFFSQTVVSIILCWKYRLKDM